MILSEWFRPAERIGSWPRSRSAASHPPPGGIERDTISWCPRDAVDTQGGLEGVAHVAFVNPDGAKTVVVSTTGAARKVQLRLGNLMTEVSLPANSVTNLSWV